MNQVSIVYATEKDYYCTVVSMLSVLESSDKDTFYTFYILVDYDFSEEFEQNILKCFRKYEWKCTIQFKKIGTVFDHVLLRYDFIKKSTYFRLLIPQLLEEERCIYLDSDTIVCTDLQMLFKTEMKEAYIAGVKAPSYILGKDKHYCEQALLPDIKQYVNAGVLLMNLESMRKDNIVEKFMKLLPLNMESQDQDIINSTCYGKIMFLPFEFNVMTKYAAWKLSDYKGVFSEEELKNAWNNPNIIHYADRVKPWKNFNCVMGDYWWNVCKRSPMWDHYYKIMSEELFFGTVYSTNYSVNPIVNKRMYTLFDLSYKKEIVIFGAGNRASKFIIYLKRKGILPEFILVSDGSKNPCTLEGIEVKELTGNLLKKSCEKTIIISTLEKYHAEILSLLQKYKFKEIIPLRDTWELIGEENI